MSGIKVERFLVFVYMLSATLAGIAGLIIGSQYGAASISFGQNAELRTIAATAIGGASLSGGTGTVFGTVLGVLFLAMIYNAFNMTGVNTYWQDVAIGAMLLIAVFLGEYLKRRQVAR
jgi:ribose transport system permease protein